MKTNVAILMSGAMFFTPATRALAETAARQDNSQYLVWAFLGMCALIVIVQLMPVIILAYGLVKGLFKGKEAAPAVEVTPHK
jgi:hypothetical protein